MIILLLDSICKNEGGIDLEKSLGRAANSIYNKNAPETFESEAE